jgi:hypothetical protein
MKTTHLDSVFPMTIALFNLGHFPIDLSQDCCSTFLGVYDGVRVGCRRYKLTVGVTLDSDTRKVTTKCKFIHLPKTITDVRLLLPHRFCYLRHLTLQLLPLEDTPDKLGSGSTLLLQAHEFF